MDPFRMCYPAPPSKYKYSSSSERLSIIVDNEMRNQNVLLSYRLPKTCIDLETTSDLIHPR